jgi:ParB/RepB/Spo0J family partition protein
LVESSTNPRKTFDEERLEELAESIRCKGILSPLLTRRVNSHFEIVSGARRQAKGNGSKFTVLSVATQRSSKNADDE